MDKMTKGLFYKDRKGCKVSQPVTVYEVLSDGRVSYCWGHHSNLLEMDSADIAEELSRLCLTKMICNSDKIITKISKKQKALLDAEEKKYKKMCDEFSAAKENIRNGFAK